MSPYADKAFLVLSCSTLEQKVEPVEVCALGALAVVLFQPVDVLTEAHTQFDSRPVNLK